MSDNTIEDLRRMLILQMTGDDYVRLVRYAYEPLIQTLGQVTGIPKKVEGIDALAHELGCSPSKIYEYRKLGILRGAEISHIGKAIIFDVGRARELIHAHKNTIQ